MGHVMSFGAAPRAQFWMDLADNEIEAYIYAQAIYQILEGRLARHDYHRNTAPPTGVTIKYAYSPPQHQISVWLSAAEESHMGKRLNPEEARNDVFTWWATQPQRIRNHFRLTVQIGDAELGTAP